MALALLASHSFETPCTITVEQSPEHFHAHVELADDVEMQPGDKVRVHGAPIQIPFGTRQVFERRATVTRASPLARRVMSEQLFEDRFDGVAVTEGGLGAGEQSARDDGVTGRPLRIIVRARNADGSAARRNVVVELTGNRARPFVIRSRE